MRHPVARAETQNPSESQDSRLMLAARIIGVKQEVRRIAATQLPRKLTRAAHELPPDTSIESGVR